MMLYGVKKDPTDIDEPDTGTWQEVCYWRKANQVHAFFNKKYIKQQDPWGLYEIEEKDLQGLLILCQTLTLKFFCLK